MRCRIDDEMIMPLHVTKEECIDPNIHEPSCEIYNVAVGAKEYDGF